jgi:hypothetical protein
VLPGATAGSYTGRMQVHRASFVLAPVLWAAVAAAGAATAPPIGAESLAACERSAREAVSSGRGPAAEVRFETPPTVLPGPSDATELVLRGAGRSRGAAGVRLFSYSCNVNARSGEVSGVVVRDT